MAQAIGQQQTGKTQPSDTKQLPHVELAGAKNVAEALANVIRSIDQSSGAEAAGDELNMTAAGSRQVIGDARSVNGDNDDDDDDALLVERRTAGAQGGRDGADKNSAVEHWTAADIKSVRAAEYNELGEKQSCDRGQANAICSCNNGSPRGQRREMMNINKNKLIVCTYSYMTDDQLLKSNIIVFIVNVTLWLPFILISIASQYRETFTVELRDAVWWFSALNCCSCSYIYALTNRDFRDAFNKLFYYCCCKSHVTFQRKTPVYRRQLDVDPNGNLRVHIIPGLNVHSNKQLMSNQSRPAVAASSVPPAAAAVARSTPLPAPYSPVIANEPAAAAAGGSLSMQMTRPNAAADGSSKSVTGAVDGLDDRPATSSSTRGLGPQHSRRHYHRQSRPSQASLSFGPSPGAAGASWRADDITTSATSGQNRLRKTFGFGGPLFSHASSQHHQYGRGGNNNSNLQHL